MLFRVSQDLAVGSQLDCSYISAKLTFALKTTVIDGRPLRSPGSLSTTALGLVVDAVANQWRREIG